MVVGCLADFAVPDRYFVLVVAVLGVVLLHGEPLVLRGRYDGVRERGSLGHADGGEAERAVEGHIVSFGVESGKGELSLQGRGEMPASLGSFGSNTLQERPGAGGPGRSVSCDHINRQGGATG